MSGFKVNFSVNNQLATPSIHAAALANRPAAGQVGRLFVDTDNPSTGMYRDTGTTWIKIAAPSSPEADTLQTVTDRGNTTTQSITIGAATVPVATVDVRRTTASLNGASDWAIASVNSPTIPAGASFGVNFVNAVNGSQALTFAGNATIGNTGLNSAGMFINTLGSSGAGTVTVGQSTTIRTLAAIHSGVYFNTAAATTFSHVANIKTIVPINSGAAAATVTNYYGVLVSDSTPSAGTINFTNRFGIYQEGASDINYFAGNTLIGTTTNAGYRLDVSGTFRSTGDANINGLTVGKGGGSVGTNTAFGYEALFSNTSATNNVSLGYRTLRSVTTGGWNVGIGANSVGDNTSTLFSLTTGNYNVGVGIGALRSVVSANGNVALGYAAGESTTAQYGTFHGYAAGYQVTTGEYNTIVGGLSGWGITTGSNNTIIGARVQGLSSSLSNTIILADGQGNQRIYVNNSGNTGIGTTSPAARLHVNGTLRIDGQSSGTAGGSSGQHLIINLDGTTYKIALLNP